MLVQSLVDSGARLPPRALRPNRPPAAAGEGEGEADDSAAPGSSNQ